ncbi:helix-turn-helix transcriptional regulator [Sorangium sp. So ce1024]|uniref:helix-turn-helix transcriptional regulator n=1 Tax=unclassified Sorangium TaxID=2621164 RepID=UPI003F0AB0B1
MHRVLDAMVSLSPMALGIMACFAFGLALAAREALGRERGLRAAAERARDAALKTLVANKDWELEEIGRLRRLLDCHIDAIVAEATAFRERAVPSPGAVLEGLCSWHADWKRNLGRATGLQPSEVDRLLKNALPVRPALARKLELFTGAPARYWEHLWRLHDDYRAEVDQTVVMLIDGAQRGRKAAPPEPRPVLQLADEGPAVAEPATPRVPPVSRPVAPQPPAAPPAQRDAAEPWRPAASEPAGASTARRERGGLPPPPKPRGKHPRAASTSDRTPAHGRAATLTDFPVLRGDARPGDGDGWAEVERALFEATLPGTGGKPRV